MPEQRERADPLVLERFAQGDARAERPAEHERRTLRALADAPIAARTSRSSSLPAAVRAARAHRAAEVEDEGCEASLARQLVPDRPQDGVVLAASVPGMGVADRRPTRVADRRASRSSPSRRTPSSVRNETVSTSATMPVMGEMRQPRGTAFTIRDPLPWPDVAAIARAGEELGYAAVFLPETGARDTLATLGRAGGGDASSCSWAPV